MSKDFLLNLRKNVKSKDILIVLYVFFSLASCSLKNKDKENLKKIDELVVIQSQEVSIDSDSDGLMDSLEQRLLRDSRQAVFPRFDIVDFEHTNINIRKFGEVSNKEDFLYRESDNKNYSLDFDLVKSKMAKNAYLSVTERVYEPLKINFSDSNILKISNYSPQQRERINQSLNTGIIEGNRYYIELTSTFKLKANNLKGIVKIFNIKMTIGYIDSDGGFESLIPSASALSKENDEILIESSGNVNESTSTKSISVVIQGLDIEELKRIMTDGNNLALRIDDYEVSTLDNREYVYSSQISLAESKGTMFSFYKEKKTELFFNTRNESVEETLARKYENHLSDEDQALLSIGDVETNTYYPIIFERGGNSHMNKGAWYLSSKNNKTSDIPTVSNSVSVGFFKNHELAVAAKRIKIDSIQEHSIHNNLALNAARPSLDIKNLILGETLTIYLKGKNIFRVQSDIQKKKMSYTYALWCPGGIMDDCGEYDTHKCDYYYGSKKTKEISLYLSEESALLKGISFTAEKKSQINQKDVSFFNLGRPFKKSKSEVNLFQNGEVKEIDDAWVLSIKITKEFIEKFGESLKISFLNNPEAKKIRTGFMGFLDDPKNICTNNPFVISGKCEGECALYNKGAYQESNSEVARNYNINIIRKFE